MTDETVPADLARLWRLPAAGSRVGRPADLDVEQVVRAAIDLADRVGLAGVTLVRVAESLGFTKMALYRHVGSKDELLELMVDRVAEPVPDLTGDGWRPDLRLWAFALREVFTRHPWLSQLPISGPPRGPGEIAWLDTALRALRDTGLSGPTKLGIATVLSGYVRQQSALEQELTAGARSAGMERNQAERDYASALAAVVDRERFPDVAALFAADPFAAPDSADPQKEFTFGLELILDGVDAAIRRE